MNRISWIDIARGIGIILVLQAHVLSEHTYRHFIYAFHMPLFFFLSGFLFDYRKYFLTVTFNKSIRGILIPYFLFAFLSYFIWLIQSNAIFNFDFSAFLIHMSGIIYGNSSSIFFNIVLWFLPCLFISKIFFAAISKLFSDVKILSIILVLFSILGYSVAYFSPNIHLPFGMESALTAIVFFGAGSMMRTNFPNYFERFSRNKSIVFIFASFIMLFIVGQINFVIYGEQIDIRMNHLGNYFLLYTGAFSGIIMTIFISKIISKNKILEIIGINSLVLFALHPIVFNYFDKLLRLITTANLWVLKDNYLSYIYTIFGIAVILGISYFYRRIVLFKTRFLKVN